MLHRKACQQCGKSNENAGPHAVPLGACPWSLSRRVAECWSSSRHEHGRLTKSPPLFPPVLLLLAFLRCDAASCSLGDCVEGVPTGRAFSTFWAAERYRRRRASGSLRAVQGLRNRTAASRKAWAMAYEMTSRALPGRRSCQSGLVMRSEPLIGLTFEFKITSSFLTLLSCLNCSFGSASGPCNP